MHLVYFIYGLAFFSMGLAIILEAGRAPTMIKPVPYLLLAAFGIIHSSHEWLEMLMLNPEWLSGWNPVVIHILRILILVISFSILLAFGVMSIKSSIPGKTISSVIWFLLLGILALIIFLASIVDWQSYQDRLVHVDVFSRYFIAIPAALTAGYALFYHSTLFDSDRNKLLNQGLKLAALGFFIYAFTQFIVPQSDFFPASKINTTTFFAQFGIPIQMIRAGVALMIMIGILLALRMMELDRQRMFLESQLDRLTALEQLNQEMKKREILRQEHLQHVVNAHENERMNIAHELHDETAQILTAFTLHLAALEKRLVNNLLYTEEILALQQLSQQMSLSILRLVHDLRPAQLDELGLVAAIEFLVDEYRGRLNMDVQLAIKGQVFKLDPVVETVLFRITQEALTNIVRHSGVKNAELTLTYAPSEVRLFVTDHGIGFNYTAMEASQMRWGLEGMKERVQSIGGIFNLETALGKGTALRIEVPPYPTVREEFIEMENPDGTNSSFIG